MGVQYSSLCGVCGHTKDSHIHEEGACRPGYECPHNCERFVSVTEPDTDLDIKEGERLDATSEYLYEKKITFFKARADTWMIRFRNLGKEYRKKDELIHKLKVQRNDAHKEIETLKLRFAEELNKSAEIKIKYAEELNKAADLIFKKDKEISSLEQTIETQRGKISKLESL